MEKEIRYEELEMELKMKKKRIRNGKHERRK